MTNTTDPYAHAENLRQMSRQLDLIQCEIVLQAADALTAALDSADKAKMDGYREGVRACALISRSPRDAFDMLDFLAGDPTT